MLIMRSVHTPHFHTSHPGSTVTLLVTRVDEETGRYRSQLAALEQYGAANRLPLVSNGELQCGHMQATGRTAFICVESKTWSSQHAPLFVDCKKRL